MGGRAWRSAQMEALGLVTALFVGGLVVKLLWGARPAAMAAGRPIEDIWAMFMLGLCPLSILLSWPSSNQPGGIAEDIQTLAYANAVLYGACFAFARFVRWKAPRLTPILSTIGLVWAIFVVWVCLSWR